MAKIERVIFLFGIFVFVKMTAELTFEELSSEFHLLNEVFNSGRKEPFYSIVIRRPYKDGYKYMTLMENLRRKQKGLPLKNLEYIEYKESEFIAVITLGGVVKPYEFKIKPDGSFVYNIPFEYAKQSIGKWVKYISRWLNSLNTFSAIRQQIRCLKIRRELIERTSDFLIDD